MKTFYLEKSLIEGGRYPIFFEIGHSGGGIPWIDFIKDYNFPKCNSLMEMCCGPGFIGYFLKHKYDIPKLELLDIHQPVEVGIKQTNKFNGWEDEVTFHLSDSFSNYKGDKVDMIVSNPPHLKSQEEWEYFKKNQRNANSRILLDDNLNFHTRFLNELSSYLNKGGYLFLLENKNYIPPKIITDLNPNLKLIDYIDHKPFFLYSGLFQLN